MGVICAIKAYVGYPSYPIW